MVKNRPEIREYLQKRDLRFLYRLSHDKGDFLLCKQVVEEAKAEGQQFHFSDIYLVAGNMLSSFIIEKNGRNAYFANQLHWFAGKIDGPFPDPLFMLSPG